MKFHVLPLKTTVANHDFDGWMVWHWGEDDGDIRVRAVLGMFEYEAHADIFAKAMNDLVVNGIEVLYEDCTCPVDLPDDRGDG